MSVPRSWEPASQIPRFELVYEQYTENFGYLVGDTHIISECRVLTQQIGISSIGGRGNLRRLGRSPSRTFSPFYRRLQASSTIVPNGYPLTLRFTMRYGTRVGAYDISDYNQRFMEYVNSNLAKVVEDFELLELSVVYANG